MSMRLGSISSTRGRLRAIILAVVVMAASAVALPQASAAPPGNDAFLSAQPLTGLPADATGSNVDATREPGEPDHAGNAGGASIWYSWTPSASGRISIDTCFSEFDTLLAVYTGSALAGLVPVAAADDTCGTRSEVTFTATEGTTYRIAVDGYAGASGVSRLRIVNPIANDDFAAAQVLTGSLPIQVAATNVGTTKEPGEPAHGGNAGGSSIWYSWTATATGPVVIDACGSTFWAQVGVYTGQAVDSLTSAVGADERCDENQGSRLVRLAAVAGTTYRIAVDGLNGATGDIKLRIQNAPANDQFATAQQLSGTLPIDVTGSNFGATGEPGEPVHAGASGSHSIWYSWTAVGSGPVTVSTCGSDFDTVLGVYTGTVVTDLGLVAANNNGCGTRSTVTFNASSGKTYRIAVDGIPGAQGSTATGIVRLIVRTPNLPPNDDFGTSQTLVGTLPISVTGTNIDATSQPGEPAHAGADGGASVWYSWTAAASGRVTMSTCLSTFNTLLGVYT
ncbi:MAG TPA: hypothetical protein VGD71_00275, partial [Kribbella sp.]